MAGGRGIILPTTASFSFWLINIKKMFSTKISRSCLQTVKRKTVSSQVHSLLLPLSLNGSASSQRIFKIQWSLVPYCLYSNFTEPLPSPLLPLCGQCSSALSNEPLCHRADLLKSTYFSSCQSMSSHTFTLAFVPSRLPYLMSCLFAFRGNQGSRPQQHSVSGVEERQQRGDLGYIQWPPLSWVCPHSSWRAWRC